MNDTIPTPAGDVAATDSDQVLSKNLTTLQKNGKTYHILGTAHISQSSVDDVKKVVAALKPDTVCVELCETRYRALTDESQWEKLNIGQVIRDGKALFLLASLAFSSFQRRMGDQVGVKPGSELLEGIKQAEEHGAELVLADRDIQITLKRTWANLGFWKKMKLLGLLLESMLGDETITDEDLERLKEKDQLTDAMEAFAREMPEVKEPLIDERDRFLMSKIEEAPGQTIVAVVGAGHVNGMTKWLGKEVDRQSISKIPPPSKWLKVAQWLIPMLVILLFGYGIANNQGRDWADMLYAWILPNSIMCALFTLLAGARPLSILSAFLAAPITSLNPSLAAGMVVGLVEAWQRKPTVKDCEQIPDDIRSFSGFFRNQFTRCLIVFTMANFGSMIGTWVGLSWMFALVGGGGSP